MNVENGFASGACIEYEAMLEDYLDGALDTTSARKVADHLSACEGCSHALADATEASQFLRLAEPVADPGPAFARIVMARIRTEESTRVRATLWGPFVSLAWKFATTAAVALVLMVAYAARSPQMTPANNDTEVVAQNDVQDMLVPSDTAPPTRGDLTAFVTESDNAQR
jgi:anti-sigma factor RsiW